jgi:hypothetical protein
MAINATAMLVIPERTANIQLMIAQATRAKMELHVLINLKVSRASADLVSLDFNAKLKLMSV